MLKMPKVYDAMPGYTLQVRSVVLEVGPRTACYVWYSTSTRVSFMTDLNTVIPGRVSPAPYNDLMYPVDRQLNDYVLLVSEDGTFLIALMSDLPDLQASATVYYPTHYSTYRGWQRWLPSVMQSSPPAVPIQIVTSGDGGSSFATLFGSNPYDLVRHYGAGTLVLSKLWKTFAGFSGDGSQMGSNAHDPAQTPAGPDTWNADGYDGYDDGTDWHCLDFESHAVAGDTWPRTPSFGHDTGDGGFFDQWPLIPMPIDAWHTPEFHRTIPFYGFDATALAGQDPLKGTPYIDSSTPIPGRQGSGDPAGNNVQWVQEDILVRGKITLPAMPPGTLTGISLIVINGPHGDFVGDHVNLNAPDYAGLNSGSVRPIASGASATGRFPSSGVYDWKAQTESLWIWGGDNLLTMYIRGRYDDGTRGFDSGMASYISITFTFDNGTSWASPPIGWEVGTGDDFVADPLISSPVWFSGITQGVDLGNVGVDGRSYFVSSPFTVPGSFSSAILKITAETGIGSIYINNTLLVSRDETIDLWTGHTILTYSVPIGDFIGGDNTIGVEVYSATGPASLFYSLAFYA